MADPTLRPLRLTDDFPPVTSEAWDAAVRQDLKGADYEKKLIWHAEEGLAVRPYYREEDLAPLAPQAGSAPGEWPWVRGSGEPWVASDPSSVPPGAIRADTLHDGGATAAQEVGYAIAEGVDRLATRPAHVSVDDAAGEIVFVFAVGSRYFVEIAKLRAARLCWAQAVAAFGPASPDAPRMRMVVRTARANKSHYDPYTNLLRATTEAMSAACGGADAVVVEATGFEAHLAANVTRILAEESRLDVVADPGGGSYYVEMLTDAIGRDAWRLLQQVESAGGYRASVESGAVAAAIARVRAAGEQAVSMRRRTLVGVNNYPDLGETSPTDAPWPADSGGVVPPWRMAGPFETLRARTERYTARTGRRPRVLLITRGDVRMRMARANFSLNFFGCAGFEVTQAEDLEGGADLVVLCSSDAEYLAFAEDVCPRTKAPVIVAGYPKEQVERLRAAGVGGFVHVQSDAVGSLTEWQERLGI